MFQTKEWPCVILLKKLGEIREIEIAIKAGTKVRQPLMLPHEVG